MRSVFGVAGKAVPGELQPLRDRVAAGGAETQVVAVPGLELLLVGRSEPEMEEWHQQEALSHAIAVNWPLHPVLTGGRLTPRNALTGYRTGGPHLADSWLDESNLLIVDEPGHDLELDTNCLGLTPVFMREARSRLVLGSEVWPLVEAGLVPPAIDPDALAACILLEHPLNGRCLFSGLQRVPRRIVKFSMGSCTRTVFRGPISRTSGPAESFAQALPV